MVAWPWLLLVFAAGYVTARNVPNARSPRWYFKPEGRVFGSLPARELLAELLHVHDRYKDAPRTMGLTLRDHDAEMETWAAAPIGHEGAAYELALDALSKALRKSHDADDASEIGWIALHLVLNWDAWLKFNDSRADEVD